MQKVITDIYENGILRPLTPVNLNEHQKVTLKIIKKKGVVIASKGMIRGNSSYLTSIRQICLKNSKKPAIHICKLLLLLDWIVGVGDVVPEYIL